MKRTVSWMLVAIFALAGWPATGADGPLQIIPLGSPLKFGGTNVPDTYSATTTFGSTPVLVDNGAVRIWQEQVPTGANGEWDIFHMQTVNGGPLAGNINANWNILLDYTLSAPVSFDQVAMQWLANGTPFSSLTNFGTICCASASNPILPGAAFYNSGFNGLLPAGVQMNWQQIFVNPYNFASSGGINVSTANEFTFALHFTLQPPGPPTISGAISAGAFGAFPTFGPGSWVEIYGTNFAVGAQTWGLADFTGPNAPIKLGGTSVSIGGRPAFVDYISPTQVNVQVPSGVSTGAQPLVVTTPVGASAPFTVTVETVKPGLLAPPSFNIGGTQYAVALFSDGVTYALPLGLIPGITSRRPRPGDTITFYGVGFGAVSPNIPPGLLTQALNTLSAPLAVSIGGTPATVSYDGLVPNYVGLYQFNVVVPAIAAGDKVPVTFSLGGLSGTQSLSIAVGN
jgi:uncharacterized protein (TIGR03437 family)